MAIHIDSDGNFYFGASGTTEFDSLSYTPVFSVTKDGVLTASSGTVGGIDLASDHIKSSNYSAVSGQEAGFRINSNGDAVFNDVTVRGDLLGVELKGEMVFNNGDIKTSTSGRRVEITDNNNTEGEIRFESNSGTTARLVADANTEFAIEQSALSGGKIKLITGVLSNGLDFTANEIDFATPLAINKPVIKLNGINANSAGTSSLSKVLGVDSSGRLSVATPTTGGVYSSFIKINNLTMQSGYNFDILGSGNISVSTGTSPGYRATISTSAAAVGPSGGLNGSSGNAARYDHEHIGTGISQINSPSVGFFSSYTFNTGTGAFSVSTASTKSTGSTMGHIYPYNTAKDLGNNFASSPSGRWRKLYVHSGVDTSSDERLKENIVDIPYGLDYINSLVPKQYTLKRNIVRGCSTCQSELSNDETECPQCVEDGTEQNIIDNLDVTGEAATKLNWGFIAQEMIATPPEPDIDLAIVDHNVSADSYGVNYQQFIAPLVKAVQELSTQISDLTARVEALEG